MIDSLIHLLIDWLINLFQGNDKAGLDPLFNMYSLEEEEEDSVVPSVRQPTRYRQIA